MGRPWFLSEEQSSALALLSNLPAGERLYLAGGSGVAAHLGHRVSNDIDLFGPIDGVELQQIADELVERLGVRVVSQTDASVTLMRGDLAIDIVRYAYPLMEPITSFAGAVGVAGLRDLGAMKLSAIANRGIRRDFWDVFEICASGLTLLDLIQSYQARFGVRQADVYHVIRCLTYFDDAEADPLLPRGLTLTRWEEIKRFFLAEAPRIVDRLGG